MRTTKLITAIFMIFSIGLIAPLSAYAAPASGSGKGTQKLTTEERILRLERKLDSQGLVDLLVRLDNLQNELQIRRGEIELQRHTLEEIQERQRDLYVDIDRRLLLIERNASAGAPTVAASASNQTGVQNTDVATNAKDSTGTDAAGAKVATGAAVSKADFAKEQQAYQQAFDLLRELRYDKAVTAFNDFIKAYPTGRYAHIAQYWIGEANYAQRNFKAAIGSYQTLIEKYPNSPKLAEAQLKIGYSYYEMKDYKSAQKHLEQLIKNYPGTTEAGQAQNLLKKVKQSKTG